MEEKTSELVDRGFSADQRMKKAEKELVDIKSTLKAIAKAEGDKVLFGSKAKAVFSDSSFTSCDPKTLFDYLEGVGREKEFWDLVKVQVAPARKALGETAFDKFSTTTDLTYHKIQFKKK